MDTFLNELNREQYAVVTHYQGPTIVLAGAGSGKTRVLVYKVLYLILEKHVDPSSILMVTFTNKAAHEMLERIKKALTDNALSLTKQNAPTVGTFHSLCARILRKDGHYIGIMPNFAIYDTHDQQEVVKEAMEKLDINSKNIRSKAVSQTISSAKNQMVDPYVYSSVARGFFQEAVAQIYPLYQSLMKDHNAVDFDDLLLETIRLFKKYPEVLEKYQEKFQYVLVDEYQDTNHAQYELTKLLGQKHRNICIVGDFSQSIYSFRGADFRNLEKFKNDFPDAATFPLSQNYRSTQNILDAAFSVISRNTTHPVLSLWTENHRGEDIELYEADSEQNEAEFIIQKIVERAARDHHFSLSDVAVLYRMNAQSRTLEEVFLHHSIPYTLVGGTRFYERKEVKDVLSLLSFLANQKDTIAFSRIEKIGKRRAQKFLEYVNEFNEKKYLETKATIDILDEAVAKIEYLALYDVNNPEDKARLENIKEMRSVAVEFPELIEFLENVSLVEQEYMPAEQKKNGTRPEAVTLMTFHAAKGLEFKMVFMVGMEEGMFPHSQALFDNGDLEEERRLCYVGITRAKEKLFMTFAKRRLFFGQRNTNTISRFIFELPEGVRERSIVLRDQDMPEYF